MAAGPTLIVTDDTTRAELIEALGNQCDHAKRQPCILGTDTMPSAWDKAHARVDVLLDEIRARCPAS
jgi:hypothetical protein